MTAERERFGRASRSTWAKTAFDNWMEILVFILSIYYRPWDLLCLAKCGIARAGRKSGSRAAALQIAVIVCGT